ncbi:MAG: hypothetical protein H6834_05410 [Planctomycetes bacterium]|nr:hypothetical protein [Planctomycetota bacterium]
MTRCLSVLLLTPIAAAQSIQITSVPPWASPGLLTGQVTGVDPATHSVAIYIYMDGAGWWTKPSTSAASVPIRQDGTFSANVVTGGVDDRATIYTAALLAPGQNPPIAQGSVSIPTSLQSLAITHRTRTGRTLQFAGRTWHVKDTTIPVGPGGNLFSDDPNDVWIDGQGRLHLTVRFRNGAWRCTEVTLTESLGPGTYWFTTESELEDLDANLTFGAFTWDPYGDDFATPGWPNREIDFEDSRWGVPGDPNTSQVAVQPWNVPGNLTRYRLPDLAGAPLLTRYFTWTPRAIEFTAARGRQATCVVPSNMVVHRSTYDHRPTQGHYVPTTRREQWHFNLWINTGGAPRDGRTAEVIVSDFRWAPERVFVGGCGTNPRGSLTVLAGSPSLGRSITLGVDNPAGTQSPGSLAFIALGAAPAPSYPCGFLLPGFGMSGPFGSLQLAEPSPLLVPGQQAWAGAGRPAPVTLAIPFLTSLLGLPLYAQGVLVDTTPGATIPVGLADAAELCFGF